MRLDRLPDVAQVGDGLVEAEGSLGEVIGLTGTNNGKLPAARDWFTDVELAGGGVREGSALALFRASVAAYA